MKQILCILLSVLGWTTGMTQNPYQIKGKVYYWCDKIALVLNIIK